MKGVESSSEMQETLILESDPKFFLKTDGKNEYPSEEGVVESKPKFTPSFRTRPPLPNFTIITKVSLRPIILSDEFLKIGKKEIEESKCTGSQETENCNEILEKENEKESVTESETESSDLGKVAGEESHSENKETPDLEDVIVDESSDCDNLAKLDDIESLIESRKVDLDSFRSGLQPVPLEPDSLEESTEEPASQIPRSKPKRDFAAEVAEELEKLRQEGEQPTTIETQESIADLEAEFTALKLELANLEHEQKALDFVANKIEEEKKSAISSGNKKEESDLITELGNLENKGTRISVKRDEVSTLASANLERQNEIINNELRKLSEMQAHEKTDEDCEREAYLMSKLVAIVNERNDLVQNEDEHQKETSRANETDLSTQVRQQTALKVGSMVNWARGVKSKLLN